MTQGAWEKIFTMPDTGFPLRIASYNLRALKDDTAAAAVVRAIAPDVLLLQELPRYPGSDYAVTSFAREAGLLWSGRTRWVSGTGLLTGMRLLPTDSRDIRLPVGLRENPRSFTVTRVRSPHGPAITVVSMHLSLRADQRLAHVRRLLAETDAGEAGPMVVGGDVNENHTGAAWSALAEVLDPVSDDRPTFPATRPQHRIDAIFSRGHGSAVPGDRRLLEGMPLAKATDHLPVWVDLTF